MDFIITFCLFPFISCLHQSIVLSPTRGLLKFSLLKQSLRQALCQQNSALYIPHLRGTANIPKMLVLHREGNHIGKIFIQPVCSRTKREANTQIGQTLFNLPHSVLHYPLVSCFRMTTRIYLVWSTARNTGGI